MMTSLYWLPQCADFRTRVRALGTSPDPGREAVALANSRLDFLETNMLDAAVRRVLSDAHVPPGAQKPLRIAILSSCTTAHLHAGLRVAGLRLGVPVEIYQCDYGQYWQELVDPASPLHAFGPTHILFALDFVHLAQGVDASMDAGQAEAALSDIQDRLQQCWMLARRSFRCPIFQQTIMPAHIPVLGGNEHNLPGSKHRFVARLNESLRRMAADRGVLLLAIDTQVQRDGLAAWFDPALWRRSKQEITLSAGPMYGELLMRQLAALMGRSRKCLVLDLDNTLWGGVVGDDGVDGLTLGQGSALGEAYVAFQDHVRELSRRGVILAVCSKNDEANPIEAFRRHPEMVLKLEDIACFVANWNDKATNIRLIAEQLNIGLDSLVFVDDNPFERTLVRQELPMVAVPEIGDDPAYFPQILADAGYFESVAVAREDRERTAQYQGNLRREALRTSTADLSGYLRALEMKLAWRTFDRVGLARIVQLINKTNQFNLTTRRVTEDDVIAVMDDPQAVGLQLRLVDRFGDNGIIAIVVGKLEDDELRIDTWVMSCRVLGRQVEPATLRLIADHARRMGAARLRGFYIPSKKNAMVADHYLRLGFDLVSETPEGARSYTLDLGSFEPEPTFISIEEY